MDSYDDTPTSVYKYFDEFGVLIYVGITSRGATRQREHNKDKGWWEFVAMQQIEHHPSRGAALHREEELIRTHIPPFNVQHNAAHSAHRSAYLHFRKMPDLDKSPLLIAQEVDKRIPLVIIERTGHELTLATPLRFAPLALGVSVQKSTKVLLGSSRCGHVLEAIPRGPSVEIRLNVRKCIEFDDAFMKLKTIISKEGTKFEVKNVFLVSRSDTYV